MDINCDVDNVVADFLGGICDVVGDQDRLKCTHYNWFNDVYGEENRKLIRETLSTSADFWADLPLVENAREGIQFLRENGHKITWVTAPYKSKYGWCDDRRLWLEKKFDIENYEEHVVFTHQKGPVMADCFIDDVPAHIIKWEKKNPNGLPLLFAAEHNRQYNREKVNWNQIMEMRCFRNDETT